MGFKYDRQTWHNGTEGGTPTSAQRFNHIETGLEAIDTELHAHATAIPSKAESARTITTTNGITGGGDLTADRTLKPVYGTTAGTVCEGNDPRLTDERVPRTQSVSNSKLSLDLLGKINGALVGIGIDRVRAMSAADYDALGANADPQTMYLIWED